MPYFDYIDDINIAWDDNQKCFIALDTWQPLDNLAIIRRLNHSPLTEDEAIWVTRKLLEKGVPKENLAYYEFIKEFL